MDSLPLHLLNEILFGINPRSLVIMQCTNKSLQSHISDDPYFKSEYFSRFGFGILHSSSDGSKLLCYHSLDDPPRTKLVSMFCLIMGSCSGLLLLSLDDGLCVANPFTKKFRFLNQPESMPILALRLARRVTYIGFAVCQIDRNTQSFKIVLITDEENLEETTYRFEINDGDSWRFSETKITCCTSDLDKRMKKPVYLDGSLHWLRKDGSIVAFNPETEQARLIPTKFPHELSLKALFAAGDKSLTLISATDNVSYVYTLENILTDPKWVLERRIRNVVLEKRLIRWNVVAYDGMCLVLMDSYVRMLHRYDLRANKWGLMDSITWWCDANRDFFQFNPSASYVIGLHEEKDMTLACDRKRISSLRSIMELVNGGMLSKIMKKQFREISVEEDNRKSVDAKEEDRSRQILITCEKHLYSLVNEHVFRALRLSFVKLGEVFFSQVVKCQFL